MTTKKIVVRIGTAATVPTLDVGEPGWDTDTKVGRYGDGTSSPPQIPTTKSNIPFEFPDIPYFKVKSLTLFQDGKIDGVTPSGLNKSNGFIVRTGDNKFSTRTFEGQANYIKVDNGNGMEDKNVKITLDESIIKKITDFKAIDVGGTDSRPNPAALGTFRYNTDTALFEGYVDSPLRTTESRYWRYIPTVSKDAVIYDFNTHFNSINDFKNWINLRVNSNKVSLRFPPGKTSFADSTWNFDDCTANVVELVGSDPIPLTLAETPVVAVTGSTNNWSVTYQLNSAIPDTLAIGAYVAIDIENLSGLTGSCSNYDYSSVDSGALAGKTIISSFDGNGGNVSNLDSTKAWVMSLVADYSLGIPGIAAQALYSRKVASVAQNSISLTNGFPAATGMTTMIVADEILNTKGNVTTTSNIINTTGTDVSKIVEAEDLICVHLATSTTSKTQIYRVRAVTATSITVYETPSTAISNATIMYIKTGMLLHTGAWRVTSVDRTTNRIVIENKAYNQPPSTYAVKKLKMSWVPTVIERANSSVHLNGVGTKTTISLKNIIFNCANVYGNTAFEFKGSKVLFDGIVGFTRWKKAGSFEVCDIVGSGNESIMISDTLSPSTDQSFTGASFDLRGTRAIINRVTSIAGSNSPFYIRGGSETYIRNFRSVGNNGYGLQALQSTVDFQNPVIAFNGPGTPDVGIDRYTAANFNNYNIFTKTSGAPPDNINNGGAQPSFAGPGYTTVAECWYNKGIASSLNASAITAGGQGNHKVLSSVLHCFALNSSFLFSFGGSAIEVVYSSMFYQGPSLLHNVDSSTMSIVACSIEGIYYNFGTMSNNSTFASSLLAAPSGTGTQYLSTNFSKGSAVACSPTIVFTNTGGSTSYTA